MGVVGGGGVGGGEEFMFFIIMSQCCWVLFGENGFGTPIENPGESTIIQF